METPDFPPEVRIRLFDAGPGKDRVIGAEVGGLETGGGGGIIAEEEEEEDLSEPEVEEEVVKALELARSLDADVVF